MLHITCHVCWWWVHVSRCWPRHVTALHGRDPGDQGTSLIREHKVKYWGSSIPGDPAVSTGEAGQHYCIIIIPGDTAAAWRVTSLYLCIFISGQWRMRLRPGVAVSAFLAAVSCVRPLLSMRIMSRFILISIKLQSHTHPPPLPCWAELLQLIE